MRWLRGAAGRVFGPKKNPVRLPAWEATIQGQELEVRAQFARLMGKALIDDDGRWVAALLDESEEREE